MMDLGQRLKEARLEAGLSQRALCDGIVTRNMLSQIENGSARPSMDTLRQLSQRLGKTVSFFLEEDTVTSSNVAVMDAARRFLAAGAYDRALGELADYREPDPLFDQERQLIHALCLLAQAEEAARQGKTPYALVLLRRLEKAARGCLYWGEIQERHRKVLLASLKPEKAADLPADDDALLARARWAMKRKDYPRAAQYLDAAEICDAGWCLLRGEAAFHLGNFAPAAEYFHEAEKTMPGKAIPWLERCYKELGDYKRAYEYACKRR